MTRYVEWSEPWQHGNLPTDHVECISRMKVEDAIKYQQGIYYTKWGHLYDSEELALHDFMTINWASFVEVSDE